MSDLAAAAGDNATGTSEQDALPGYGWTASTEGISFYLVVFLSLLALNLVLCKLLHNRPMIASILPEAGLAIIVGTLASFIIRLVVKPAEVSSEDADVVDIAANQVLTFSSTTFFVALLPPIIFNSGYQLKMELFLEDFTPIVSLACVGTAISAVVVSLLLQVMVGAGFTGDFVPSFSEILTFGALISATDPVSTLAVFQTRKVDPRLFYLVVGESVLNDAVGLVLFNALSKFVGHERSFVKVTVALLAFIVDFSVVSVGSLCLGVFSGFMSGLVLKTVDMRSTWVLELSLYMLVMYLPFFVAEVLHLSGIVTILFCGISAKRYSEPNLSRITTRHADALFQVTSHLAESAIFLELGLSVFGLQSRGNFHFKFIACAMFACLVGRMANIYPIAFVYNRLQDRKCRHAQSSAGGGDHAADASLAVGRYSSEDYAGDLGTHDLKMGPNTCHMLWFSGLRGAVAYACAKTFPNANGHQTAFCITTMVMVLITTFFFGGTTEIALDILNIDVGVDEEEYIRETGGKRAGFVQTFEERYVFPCVIRDYGNAAVDSVGDDLLLHEHTEDIQSRHASATGTSSREAHASGGHISVKDMPKTLSSGAGRAVARPTGTDCTGTTPPPESFQHCTSRDNKSSGALNTRDGVNC